MATVRVIERRLAVTTVWGLFGSFALCSVLSGFSEGNLVWGLVGFAVLVAGLVAHVIINWRYRTGFSSGETVLGFLVFGIALLVFLWTWIFDRNFGETNGLIGLAGFGAIIACFVAYVVIKFGLRGAFSMFHQLRRR
jgi:hypothetical protein